MAVYYEPQRLLIPCHRCGLTVLRGLEKHGKIKKLATPLSPVFGEKHQCGEGGAVDGPQEVAASQRPSDYDGLVPRRTQA